MRRIPDFNPPTNPKQESLFELWWFYAFFTTSNLGTVAPDKTQRGHAFIEQVNARPEERRPGAPGAPQV